MHLIIFLLVVFPATQSCYFRAPPSNKEFENERFESTNSLSFTRKLSVPSCDCGVDYPGDAYVAGSNLDKKWILYIHVGEAPNKTICVGTIVNSNMVITSHKCFQKKGHITVEEVMRSKMQHWRRGSSLAGLADITLSTETDLASPSNREIKVKKLIYSERYAYDSQFEQVPETDIVILVVDYDFTTQEETNTNSPICLALSGQLTTSQLLNREGIYQGIRHWSGYPYTLGVFNFSHIRPAEECNKYGRLGLKPASNETLCLKFTQPGPTIEGGPIRINLKRFIEGGSPRSFLVGISSWVEKTIMNAKHKYTYFTNVDTTIKYIERKAMLHNSTWCSTPVPDDKQWPWEHLDRDIMEGTLDCQCGFQKELLNSPERIGGGENAKYREFPWLAKITVVENYTKADGTAYGQYSRCGGSLINDRMILTAAHCFVRIAEVQDKEGLDLASFPGRPDVHQILLHSYFDEDLDDELYGVKFYQVRAKKIVFHPGFPDEVRDARADYDIALLILEEPLTLGKETKEHFRIDPICLPKKGFLEDIIGQNVTVAGWGITNFSDPGSAAYYLKKLNVPVRPLEDCAEMDRDIGQLFQPPTDTKICASWFNPHENAGQGDSGGPLMHQTGTNKFTQVGIVSYLNAPDDNNSNKSTTYYANVEAFLPYIYYYSKESSAQYCRN